MDNPSPSLPKAREALYHLRCLRLQSAAHFSNAAEYLHRCSAGMSARQALNLGGTGRCPLTDYAWNYMQQRELGLDLRRQADALWAALSPALEQAPAPEKALMELFYNRALPWPQVRQRINRSQAACYQLQWAGIGRIGSALPPAPPKEATQCL